MQPWNINAEMTTTTRCGLLRYTFPAGQTANVLLPLSYANTPVHSSRVRLVDDRTVSGAVTSEAFYSGDGDGKPRHHGLFRDIV